MIYVVSYGFSISLFLFFFLRYIDSRMCFVRGTDSPKGRGLGVDFNYTMGDLLTCYAQMALTTWLLLILLAFVGMLAFVTKESSNPTKVTIYSMFFVLGMHFIFSIATAKQAHNSLVDPDGF